MVTTVPAVCVRSPEYPPVPESVAAAREFVLETCARWGVGDASEVAVLLVSELATNAVRYARTPVTVWLARRPGHIVVTVEDGSPTHSHLAHPELMDEQGRGMQLVDLLSEEWGEREVLGVRDDLVGKRVWAEIATS